MKWPLYEEAESLTNWLLMEDNLNTRFIAIYYFLYVALAFTLLIYKPIKYLKKNNVKESFWDKYDTGGI
tara:strand:+ start:1186 stop:1392 length:207 start_codon:yes stop_codon:yes gene_type:complete